MFYRVDSKLCYIRIAQKYGFVMFLEFLELYFLVSDIFV